MGRVKIDRQNRRVVHEVFPVVVLGPLRSVRNQLDWMIRAHKDGLTPGERDLLEKRAEMISLITDDMQKIYFRLKH